MKPNIHPQKHKVLAQCVCTNEFYFYSALDTKVIHVEVCNKCHPFYTGKQQVVATTGRVDNFNSKFTNFQEKRKAAVALEPKPSKVKKTTKAKDTTKEKAKDSKHKDVTTKGEKSVNKAGSGTK